jgi:hypothetical protein
MVGGQRDGVTRPQKDNLTHKPGLSSHYHQVDAVKAETGVGVLDEVLAVSVINDFEGSGRDAECVGEGDVVLQGSEVGDEFTRADAFDDFEGDVAAVVVDEGQTLACFEFEGVGLGQLD